MVKDNQKINLLNDYLNGSAVLSGKPYSTFLFLFLRWPEP